MLVPRTKEVNLYLVFMRCWSTTAFSCLSLPPCLWADAAEVEKLPNAVMTEGMPG
ncbi:MAG: hypothetical protein IJ503_10615 [Akkermansia sp.]|nr:hypothetical protein [Akkermansia sp.]